MTHEKIIKRDDGIEVIIKVYSLITRDGCQYNYNVFIKSESGYLYYANTNLIASKDEILSAKLELWEKLKPVI